MVYFFASSPLCECQRAAIIDCLARQGGGIEPLHVSMPRDLKSRPNTSPTHPGPTPFDDEGDSFREQPIASMDELSLTQKQKGGPQCIMFIYFT